MTSMLDTTSDARPAPGDLVLIGGGDDNFSLGIAMTFYSAVSHQEPGSRVFLYVLDGGLKPATRERLHRLLDRADLEIFLRYIRADVALLEGLRTPEHLTINTYFRLLIPRALPFVEKAIYIDTDMLVRENLQKLNGEPLGNNLLLAVREMGFAIVANGLPETYRTLNLNPNTPYFNAGIMVFNPRQWAEEKVSERILDYTRDYEKTILCADQDGINAVLAGRIGELDPRWNVQVAAVATPEVLPDTEYKRQMAPLLPNLLREAYILHYLGRKKPWTPSFANPERGVFVEYLKRSGWFSPDEFAAWERGWLMNSLRRFPAEVRNKVASRFGSRVGNGKTVEY